MSRSATRTPELEAFRQWAKTQFLRYRGAVAYVVTELDGEDAVGTAFHVGEGVFVTARHVVEGRVIKEVGFGDRSAIDRHPASLESLKNGEYRAVRITDGPYFHTDPAVDVACFRIDPFPASEIPLGGHLDDWLGQFELVLHRTLLLGYPPIPLTNEPVLVVSVGEVNSLVDLYVGCRHPHFIISSMARGGFSGAPALVAYDELNSDGGTAVLGLVTQSLTRDQSQPELGYMAILSVEPIYNCLEQHGMLPASQKIGVEGE